MEPTSSAPLVLDIRRPDQDRGSGDHRVHCALDATVASLKKTLSETFNVAPEQQKARASGRLGVSGEAVGPLFLWRVR